MEGEERAGRAGYWAGLAGGALHVEDARYQRLVKLHTAQRPHLSQMRGWLQSEGYTRLPAAMPWAAPPASLVRGIEAIRARGWPPSFILMFDEAWAYAHQTSGLAAKLSGRGTGTGGNRFNFDILAWYVVPGTQAGFAPHRDRQPDDIAASFHSSGAPKYTTCWVALSNACTENSCLYVVPRHADPGYTSGDLDDTDPLERALPAKEAYQNIRALPCTPGEALYFSHRILHWGSRGLTGHPEPRVALSFAFSSDDFEAPYLDRACLPFPSLAQRLALCCAQMLIYHERFHFEAARLRWFYSVFRASEAEFSPDYAAKVHSEYGSAVAEAFHGGGGEDITGAGEAESDDAAMDEALDAMLENPDLFPDDFEAL